MKEHAIFAFKVAVAILILNQVGPLWRVANTNYLGVMP
jgi:hypothetical protein